MVFLEDIEILGVPGPLLFDVLEVGLNLLGNLDINSMETSVVVI